MTRTTKTMRLHLWAAMAVALNAISSLAFAPLQYQPHHHVLHTRVATTTQPSLVVLHAGGFEWDDPTEAFDQGVENPFKNPGLMNSEEGLKIDPARLLGPRLNGANLYLIGMMGSGKSSVGDIVARRE
jgi:shikimate kinase